MTDEERRKLEEMLQACAKHALDRHTRLFAEMGFQTSDELKAALEKAIMEPDARSFERQPDPARGQTEPSLVIQAQLADRSGQPHQVTVILNPDRDDQGRVHGGTAIPNDPKRRLEIGHLINRDVRERGIVPTLALRGEELFAADDQVQKSPVSRLETFVSALEKKAETVKEPQKRETYMERMQRLNPITEEQLATERQRQEQLRQERDRSRDGTREREWEPDR